MRKLEYIHEKDFNTELVEFQESFCELSEKLFSVAENNFDKTYPLMVRSDKKSLCFFIEDIPNSSDKNPNKDVYRITIEKMDN